MVLVELFHIRNQRLTALPVAKLQETTEAMRALIKTMEGGSDE